MNRLLALAAACLISAPAIGQTARTDPQLFVYKGAGCTGLAALPQFERAVGRKADGVIDFVDYRGGWAQMQGEAAWALSCWRGRGYKLALSVPMLVSDGKSSLEAAASGEYDGQYVQLARALVRAGFRDAYIRLGWEFNGGWYPWSAAPNYFPHDERRPSLWIAAFRREVMALRSVPGQHFKIVWNPALWMEGVWPDQAYPGDDVVDVIGVDAYCKGFKPKETAAQEWQDVAAASWGLDQVVRFAKAHNKPSALPEWGTGWSRDNGCMDDPLFIRNVAVYVKNNRVAFHGYWDYNAGDYNSMFSDGKQFQASRAEFTSEFGGG